MRIEIAGAQITEAVVEVLDTLQNESGVADSYLSALDTLTRMAILSTEDGHDAMPTGLLLAVQKLRRDIATLATPPDADDPANDIPLLSM